MTKMKINNIYAAAFTALAVSFNAGAQNNLSGEVKVEHEVLPTSTDAPRMDQSPVVNLPRVTFKTLNFSESTVSAPLTPQMMQLEPAAWADTIYTSPYSGYAMLGYFPMYNMEASAGYKFLDTDHTRLTGWLQMDGHSYGSDSHKYDRNTLSLGGSLHQAVGKKSFIDVGIGYTIDGFNTLHIPYTSVTDPEIRRNQLVNRFGLSGTWSSSVAQMKYSAGVSYSYFGYRNLTGEPDGPSMLFAEDMKPVREHDITLHGNISMPFSSVSSIGADIRLATVSTSTSITSRFIQDENMLDYRYAGYYHEGNGDRLTHALLSVNPHYDFKTSNLSGKLGAILDFTFNRGTVFHVAPAAEVTWTPAKWLAINVQAKGGVRQNTTASLFDRDFGMAAGYVYRNSYVPVDVRASVTLGPWKGAFAEGYFRWAKANDWLMPTITDNYNSIYASHDISGWMTGVKIGAEYRDMARLTLKAEMTAGGYDKGWYEWNDRARYVAGASLLVKPMAHLKVTADYELRAGRRIMDRHTFAYPEPTRYEVNIPLRNISDISVGGIYEFTDQLSFFLQLNNLLSRSPRYVSGIDMQRFHGLIGAQYKF